MTHDDTLTPEERAESRYVVSATLAFTFALGFIALLLN